MANAIAIVGDSGSGKSTSVGQIPELGIVGLDPTKTFIINVKGKPLPMRGWKAKYKAIDLSKPPKEGNYLATVDAALIIKTLTYINMERPDITNIVLDDFIYIMSDSFMSKALQSGFDKFNILGKSAYDVINTGINMKEDKNFILITHDDEENGKAKMKFLGKLLEDKVNPIGMFTTVLFATTSTTPQGVTSYHFITNKHMDNRGILIPAKSPIGMFEDKLIPNDMGYVLEKVENYYKGE
jgi:hypothetical protein